MEAIERYRKRRDKRLRLRGFRKDAEDDGEWRTTEDGHKIMIKDGVVVGGNPHVMAVMGPPDGKSIPKKSIKTEYHPPFEVRTPDERSDLYKSLSKRSDKSSVFGGFYKVEEKSTYSTSTATFFNPFSGAYFYAGTRDTSDDRYQDGLMDEFAAVPINKEASWLWKRSNGVVQEGDTVRVVKGRTIEHGTEAKVRKVHPFYDRYGRHVADYAYLDNGQKINVNNVGIVEDGRLVGESGEVAKKEAAKPTGKKEAPAMTKAAIQGAIGKVKTEKAIASALKSAGYKFKNRSAEYGYPDFDIDDNEGGKYRIYVTKGYDGKELKIQHWTPAEEEKVKPDDEIKEAKRKVKEFTDRVQKQYDSGKAVKFSEMSEADKWCHIVARTASHFLGMGIDSKKAWSRAINNANQKEKSGYKGYEGESVKDTEQITGDIIKQLIDYSKKR